MDKAEILAGRERLIAALAPVLAVVKTTDAANPEAASQLAEAFPLAALQDLASLVREGIEAGWLCERAAGGVRFSRVAKADHAATAPLSIDAVHMDGAGPGHTHPNGEIDLCFATEGAPRFCGNAPGWTVYGAGSAHAPEVADGEMLILYFLPGGAIEFTG